MIGKYVFALLVLFALSHALVRSEDAVVLDGEGTDAWRELLAERANFRVLRETDVAVAADSKLFVLPDRLLTDQELARFEGRSDSRVLAFGKSAYSEGGSTAARALGVGQFFRYLPILYPIYIDYDADKLEEIARWTADEGAHGVALFSYVATVPTGEGGEGIFERTRTIFRSYPEWMTAEAKGDPAPVSDIDARRVLFLHLNDTKRIGPEDAVAWAQRLHANAISVEVSRVRLRNLYPGRFATGEPVVYQGETRKPDDDVTYLPRLLAAAAEAGISVHANIMIAHSPRPAEEDEMQRMSSGSTGPLPCPLSGARHYDDLAAIVEELLTMYPEISVIDLDEPRIYTRGWKDWACFCRACGELFAERYGYALKPVNVIEYPKGEVEEANVIDGHKITEGRQSINRDFREFRVWMMSERILEKFRRAINRVRPETPLLLWSPVSYDAFGIDPVEAVLHGVTILGPEFPRRAGPRIFLNHEEKFYPVEERVAAAVSADGQWREEIHAAITRVKIYGDATVRVWGESADGARWPLLVSSNGGRVLYCALDPLRTGPGGERLRSLVLDWIASE